MKCARHPSEETQLTCTSCGTPICPRCARQAPVGWKCPDCARPDRTASDLPVPLALRSLAVTLVTSIVTGFVASVIFLFLGAFVHGLVVGEMAFRSANRRAAPLVEWIAGGCAAAGLLISSLLRYESISPFPGVQWVRGMELSNPFQWVAVAIAVVFAVGRVRRS